MKNSSIVFKSQKKKYRNKIEEPAENNTFNNTY